MAEKCFPKDTEKTPRKTHNETEQLINKKEKDEKSIDYVCFDSNEWKFFCRF